MIIHLTTEKLDRKQTVILPTILVNRECCSEAKTDFVVSFAWIKYAANIRIFWKHEEKNNC